MAYDVDYSRQKRKVVERGKLVPVICVKRMNGERCKYCDKVAELYQSEDKDDRELAGKCRARSTFYMNIVDLLDKEVGVQVYGCGIENWKDLLDRLPDPDDPDDEGIDYIKPSSAKAVIIKRQGVGLKTSYSISIGTKTLSIKKKWLKSVNPLHKIVSLLENDEVELWKPKKGKNKIYILPPWSKKAEGDFYFEVVYHWNVEALNLSKDDEDEDFSEEDGDWDENEPDDIPF